jgi:hypothetical protein
METMQTIAQLVPSAFIVALLTLPWIAAAIMHIVGAARGSLHDDQWSLRAGAAVRWARTVYDPARGQVDSVVDIAARRNLRGNDVEADRTAEFYAHAA